MTQTTRIFFIENHHSYALTLSHALLQTRYNISISGICTVAAFKSNPGIITGHDVIVLSAPFEISETVDVVETLKKHFPKSNILVLCIFFSTPVAEIFIKLGVLGYISKYSTSNTIADAIKTVARGEKYLRHHFE